MASVLDRHHLSAVGGFTPVLMHRPAHDPLPEIDRILAGYDATGAETPRALRRVRPRRIRHPAGTRRRRVDMLLEIWTGSPTWPPSTASRAVLHPHVGTMIENGYDVQRVLDGSTISLCLDTGHLLIGGTDPAELTRQSPVRIAHTHLKDVDSTVAAKVRAGRLTYTEAVSQGMYRPLGTGDVDVAAILTTLQGNGYTGWYTLEQDTILTEEPRGEGPVQDVRLSADYVRSLLAAAAATEPLGTVAE